MESIQTYIAKKVANYLSESLGTTIDINRVSIVFFDRVFVDGFYVEDLKGDTLLYSGEVYVNLDLMSLSELRFVADKVGLSNATFKLKQYKGEDELNMQFILDALKPDEPSDLDPVFLIEAKSVELENCRFVFHNQNVAHKEFGVDFAHLDVSQINLSATQVRVEPNSYAANLECLTFIEHSGFVLDELTGFVKFDNTGLKSSQLTVESGKTNLQTKRFDLAVNSLKDFANFVDKVNFHVDFEPTDVSFEQLVYFVPQLKGMDQLVRLEGNVSETIARLKFSDFHIATGEATEIHGDFVLPDFRIVNDEIWVEEIRTLHIAMTDISEIKLPESSSNPSLSLPMEILNLGYIKGEGITFRGNIEAFTVSLNTLNTALGNIVFDEHLRVIHDKESDGYFFTSSDSRKNYIHFEKFNIGGMLANNQLGEINGAFGFDAKLIASKGLDIIGIHGEFDRIVLAGYTYKSIKIPNAGYKLDLTKRVPVSTVNGRIIIRDENLDLEYNGELVISDYFDMDLTLDIDCARLEKLHPSLKGRGELSSFIKIQGKGKNLNDFVGDVRFEETTYEESERMVELDLITCSYIRDPEKDVFNLRSDLLDVDVFGVIDFKKITDNIVYQSSLIFPSFFTNIKPVVDEVSKIKYVFNFKRINPVMRIFYPDILIAKNTIVTGGYNGADNFFNLNIRGDYVQYKDIKFEQLFAFQRLEKKEVTASYDIGFIRYKDSILFQELHFVNLAANDFMDSQLMFRDDKRNRSNFEWQTQIWETEGFDIDLRPSFFTINEHKWDLRQTAHINYSQECFFIENLLFERGNQRIGIDGQLSRLPSDKLKLNIQNLELDDFGKVFLENLDLHGIANVDGIIADPFNNLEFEGTAAVKDLVIDYRQIGDVVFNANLDIPNEKIILDGELIFRESRTFDFVGDYFYKKENDNIDFKLKFNNTDIAVLNSFMDPKVMNDISGALKGNLTMTGSFKEPIIKGRLGIVNGAMRFALLNAKFVFNGQLISDEMGVYINNMPVTDEEGNTGSITGTVFHDNFSNFLYEFVVNMEEHPTMRNPLNRAEPMPVDRFLVMKTVYEEESIYYGTAYVTGTANISGFNERMTINVDATTRRGTWIDFPMYGPTTLTEEGFITFKTADTPQDFLNETKIDFSNVSMNLNFNVTSDARVKLIFDPTIGDEITAFGNGRIKIGLDKYGDITMDGTYTLVDGVYNFAMGPYRQNFFIESGGTIRWMGSPYNADLNVRTFVRTIANMTAVMPDAINNRGVQNEEIYSFLTLTGDMYKPEISFDLAAPKATEANKAILARIKSDPDELNRQFFSLLIMKRFLPLAGQEGRGGAGGNAALDLLSTQINSILSQVSDDYKLKVNLDRDDVTGTESYEFGISKSFLDNRLLVSGSFGVGTVDRTGSGQQNNIIGDINIEYLLNEEGTFRINAFNVSNAHSVVQHTQMGMFTQGVGINYIEDFNNIEDFQLIQAIFDVFRSSDNRKVLGKKREKKLTPIPESYKQPKEGIKEEE
jgi:hypothetical protein